MNLVIVFGGGVILGGVLAVASMVAFMHCVNKAFEHDEDFRRIENR